MYRAIFIFDIQDLLHELSVANQALRQRVPELKNIACDALKKAWIHHHLWEDVHLALKPDADVIAVRSKLDYDYYRFNQRLSNRLVSHVGLAVYPTNNPYYHHPCSIEINQRDLRILFDFGTVDLTKLY